MSAYKSAQEHIVVELLRPDATALKYNDLGFEFLEENKITNKNMPFKVSVEKKKSKEGNVYYDYSQQSLLLPDGLSTLVRVENCIVSVGQIYKSKSGNPTKKGIVEISLNEIPYRITTYITESKNPYFVKVIAHKKPDNIKNLSKSILSPKGGSFIS